MSEKKKKGCPYRPPQEVRDRMRKGGAHSGKKGAKGYNRREEKKKLRKELRKLENYRDIGRKARSDEYGRAFLFLTLCSDKPEKTVGEKEEDTYGQWGSNEGDSEGE